jgi:signal transduction histidine kinase
MAARIDSLVRAQQGFVADASHQLRTPLTALRLRLENLAAANPDATSAAELEASLEEVARLSRLVDGLLALARADAATPELEAVDAAAVARERVGVWEPLAEERSTRLGVETPDTVTVLAVAGGLEQILDNLLANALDAVSKGGRILVTVTSGADGVTVRVDDDGPGLEQEAMARALDRFWRPPGARPGGSGLGLAIVAQLARASRGDVTLTRSPLGGLRVEVRLPPARPAAA